MDQIIVKKTCGNCKHWIRATSRVKVSKFCEEHKHLVPSYCYCPLWKPNTRVVSVALLEKYQLEK